MKKLLSLIMVLCMLTGLSTALAVDKQPEDGNHQESDNRIGLKQVLNERVKDVVAATGETVEIEAIKELEDFSGNTYYIVEFANNGYLICHGETGELVEYSTSAPSPYTGEFGELYYLGPTYYFTKNDSQYTNALYENEVVDIEDTDSISLLSAQSDAMHNSTLTLSNTRIVVGADESIASINNSLTGQVITSNDVKRDKVNIEDSDIEYISDAERIESFGMQEENGDERSVAALNYVPNGSKIKALNTNAKMGYDYFQYNNTPSSADTGRCAYVAAGIMLLWYDKFATTTPPRNDNIILDWAYLNGNLFRGGDGVGSTSENFRRGGFSTKLRSYGSADGATASTLKTALDSFFSATWKNATITANSSTTFSNIYNNILDLTKPIVVMTNFTTPDNWTAHAVVAYGKNTSTNGMIVHYGKGSYSEITITASSNPTFTGYLYVNGNITAKTLSYGSVESYFVSAVEYCLKNSIITNASTNAFNSTSAATRGVFFNALYQISGTPSITWQQKNAVMTQYNMSASAEFIDAASWGTNVHGTLNGVSFTLLNGVSSNSLGFSQSLTREQAATFLHRLAKYLGLPTGVLSGGPDATTFNDWNSVSSWAKEAMKWAVSRGILNGNGDNTLDPGGTLTRGQAAKIIHNYVTTFSTRPTPSY